MMSGNVGRGSVGVGSVGAGGIETYGMGGGGVAVSGTTGDGVTGTGVTGTGVTGTGVTGTGMMGLGGSVLEVSNLSVSYGGIGAVRDVSLQVGAGQIVTVIGPNGAGKTTLLNAVMGVHPGRGGLRFAGQDLQGLAIEDRVRAGICLVPEKRELFGTMTVEDNLRLGAFRLRGAGRAAAQAAMEDVYALFPRLRERRAQHAGTLSGGERQMLAMGRALMAQPNLLLLDEPSLGLAPLIVRDIFRIIAGLRSRGCAILLVEQNARAALQVSDYAYVLETGQVVLEGPSAALAGDARVVATYLGAGAAAL